MSDLITFLRARLDEDEATARARWDPARVLAEVAAKRAILRLYARELDDSNHAEGEARVWLLDVVLLALAQPYADHPDFDADWRVVVS